MPSSNGVYSLPPGYLATTGTPILASQHNPIFEDVAAALTLRLSRDGTAPMTGPINLAGGTVTSPSLIFRGNVGSGIYPTTNGIGVGVGGVQVAEFVPGGINGARFIGELIAYTCTVAPALTVLPYGQTLNRITYAALWTQAQIEITAGNLSYNNGDGSTTFGIPDMRGCLPAGWDKMGGVLTGRLSTAGSGVDGATLGSVGGDQRQTLGTANLPAYTPAGGTPPALVGQTSILQGTGASVGVFVTNGTGNQGNNIDIASGVLTGSAQGGTSTPVITMPPVLVTNYLLYAGA